MSSAPSVITFRFQSLMTMQQLGTYLQKSSEATRKWARRAQMAGRLPLKKAGRIWLVDQRDVDRLLNEDARRASGAA